MTQLSPIFLFVFIISQSILRPRVTVNEKDLSALTIVEFCREDFPTIPILLSVTTTRYSSHSTSTNLWIYSNLRN